MAKKYLNNCIAITLNAAFSCAHFLSKNTQVTNLFLGQKFNFINSFFGQKFSAPKAFSAPIPMRLNIDK